MTAAVLRSGAPRAHRPPHPETLPSFLVALALHVALVGWMWIAVQWHTNASPPAVAELWDLPPPMDAPTPELAAATPPPPTADAPPPPHPDIVEKREPPKPKVEPQKEPAPKVQKKAKPAPKAPTAEEIIRQQEAAENRRQDEIRRLTSQASATSRTQPMVSSNGPISNEYSARVQAAVRAHLSYPVPEGVASTVYAEFRVDLLPTGELAGDPVLTKPSGLAGFDDAALRAIQRTNPFPRRDDGSVPRSLTLKLYPQDAR